MEGGAGENEVVRFNLHLMAREGATGRHLEANDLITASRPPPLSRRMEAIC